MIGKKDEQTALELGIDQLPHMIYECQTFEHIVKNNDTKEYQRLCDQTKLVVSLLEEAGTIKSLISTLELFFYKKN